MFGSTKHQYEMQDPLKQYPRPHVPASNRSRSPVWRSEMDPKPDHGETSYKGFGRLEGRKALITGADSGIGRAVGDRLRPRGGRHRAELPARRGEPDAKEVIALIEKAGRKAYPIPGDIASEQFCNELVKQAVKSLGGLDILVQRRRVTERRGRHRRADDRASSTGR